MKVEGVEVRTCAGHGFAVLWLMTRPRNFSLRYARTAFVQCGEAPSCIHDKEERVAASAKQCLVADEVTITFHGCQRSIIVKEGIADLMADSLYRFNEYAERRALNIK